MRYGVAIEAAIRNSFRTVDGCFGVCRIGDKCGGGGVGSAVGRGMRDGFLGVFFS